MSNPVWVQQLYDYAAYLIYLWYVLVIFGFEELIYFMQFVKILHVFEVLSYCLFNISGVCSDSLSFILETDNWSSIFAGFIGGLSLTDFVFIYFLFCHFHFWKISALKFRYFLTSTHCEIMLLFFFLVS